MACLAVANIVKSSLGPVGLDKMLVRLSDISAADHAERKQSPSTGRDEHAHVWDRNRVHSQVDKVGDVIVTNDGATILQRLEVEHPAAKVLVQLAALQDQEVGDGTTSVVIIASELLKVSEGVHKGGEHGKIAS